MREESQKVDNEGASDALMLKEHPNDRHKIIASQNKSQNIQRCSKKIKTVIIFSVLALLVVVGISVLLMNNKTSQIEKDKDELKINDKNYETKSSITSTHDKDKLKINEKDGTIKPSIAHAHKSIEISHLDEYDDGYDDDEDTTLPPPNPFAWHKNAEKFPSKCGFQMSTEKIQHGKEAKLFEHPWIVAMYVVNETSGQEIFFCGGSLVSEKVIITAAHCIREKEENIEM
jgi:hypothetical protein